MLIIDAVPRAGRARRDGRGGRHRPWGTDITRVNGHGGTRHKATWRACVTMFTEHIPWLPTADLELVRGAAWHGWDLR